MSSSHRNAEQDTFRWVYLLLAHLVSQIVTYFSRYPITVKLCRRLRALNFHLVFFGLTDFAYLCLCLAFLSLTSRLTRLPVSSADRLCLSSAWSADFCGSSLVSKFTKARRLFPAPFRVCIQGCRRISEDLKNPNEGVLCSLKQNHVTSIGMKSWFGVRSWLKVHQLLRCFGNLHFHFI